jgi:nucleoside-diphosphate-sugar epimerase
VKALIIGIHGFTGRYMAAELVQAGYEVVGLTHRPDDRSIPGVGEVHSCALADLQGLVTVMDQFQPDIVIHLAAIAFVAHGDVSSIYETNLMGSRNLLDAIIRAGVKPKAVLLASSANVYGNATGGMLDELTPPAPANDYAVSKLAMEYMTHLFDDRLPIIIARPFNYTGVGQTENFLLPKIVAHVRRKAPVIELGNLDVARDFSDVRMVVQCYHRLLEYPAAIGNAFNICSGKAHTLQEVLDTVRTISGHDFEIRVNPSFVRANEVKSLLGNRQKLETLIGPITDIPLADTLRWMIESPAE